MSYQVIADFRGGLDGRKGKLNLSPGTLTQLVNGHITQGGEIEKRKAYVPLALPSLTFGAQETATGITVFGSRDILGWTLGSTTAVGAGQSATWLFGIDTGGHTPPAVGDPIKVAGSSVAGANGNWTVLTWTPGVGTAGQITVSAPGATGFNFADTGTVKPRFDAPASYLQLQHPLAGVNMTGVTASTYYNGKTACITTWDNGDALLFYGTDILKDFYVGEAQVCQSEMTPYAMANDLCDALTGTGRYTAVKPVLAKLYLVVTGGAAGGDTFTVNYNFNRYVQYADGFSQNPGTITLANAIAWTTSNNQTAANIVTAIGNATDGGGGNAGFTAQTGTFVGGVFTPGAGNVVQITSPFGLNALDVVAVTTAGNAVAFVPTTAASFDVFSIPSQSSATPYSPNVTVANGATLTNKLVSNGVAATAGVGAVGQFAINQGTPNPAASSVLTVTGNVKNNDTVTVGSTIYTFVTAVTGTPNQVLVDTSGANSLQNLVAAINGTAGAGTKYSPGTVANTKVSAAAVVGSTTTVTASAGGSSGNSIATTTTSSALAWTGATMAGGGAAATAYLTSNNTNVSNNDTVTVNGKVYTFQTALTNVDGHVLIGASADASLLNLLLAVNLTGTAGTQYAAATTLNASASAYNQDTTNHRIYLQSKSTGTAGNALTLTTTAATLTASGATFSGGGTDTNQITQITLGTQTLLSNYVAFNSTVNQTAADIVTAINAYQGTSGFQATASGNVVNLIALSPGASANQATLTVQCGGTVCCASCFFSVGATAGQNVSVIAGNKAANALTSTLTYQSTGYGSETLAQFASRIVANINAGTSGYLACAVNNQVWISSATIASTDTPENINVTATASTAVGTTPTLSVSVSPTLIGFSGGQTRSGNFTYNSQTAIAAVSGGLAPFTYTWQRANSTDPNLVAPNGQGAAQTNWTAYLQFASTGITYQPWVCVVKDAAGNSATSNQFTLAIPR